MTSIRILACLVSAATILAAATPSPALLVLNKSDNALAIVDPATGKVAGRVPTGEGPHEVVVSSDRKLAFVSNYGGQQKPGNSISVIDLVAQKELRRVDLGSLGRPHGLDFADGKLYFTAESAKMIGRYDPAADKIDWMLGTGQNTTHMVILSRDRNWIFTSNIGSNTISAIERTQGRDAWNVTQIPVGRGPEAIDISPDGKEVWTGTGQDGSVSIIEIASKKVVQTLDLHGKRWNRLKFTPDGKRVLISDDGGGDLVIVDAASRKEIKRLPVGKGPEGIQMTPDGARAYIACSGDDKIAVFDLKTLEVTGRISTGNNPDGMAWRP